MSFVTQSESQGVRRWNISRPERRNGIGTSIAQELDSLMVTLQNDLKPWMANPLEKLKVRALVISSSPIQSKERRTWIAGGDLKELAALEDPKSYAQTMTNFLQSMERLPIPVIAEIDGAAIGGGAEIALAADFRYATQASSMSFKQLKIGLAMGYGSAKRLIDLVGLAKAKELLFFCRSLSAEESLACGLFTKVEAGPESLAKLVEEALNKLISIEPQSLAAQKSMFFNATQLAPLAQSAELKEFVKLWRNPTHEEFLSGY
jgi:enoyl-CoA hydratase/carnithine racemase